MSSTARDLYLASLDSNAELNARRLAERSRIPDDDAMWLLLHEMQQSAREVTRAANAALANEPFAHRLSSAIAASVADDERVVAAVTAGVSAVQDSAVCAIRSLEAKVRDVARARTLAPFSSLVFAFALSLVVGCAAIWASYHAGSAYGYDLGYHSGYHDRILYERSPK